MDGGYAVFAGAIGLGLLHGLEPGHGWPLAASYALARTDRWAAGLAASVILGVGHLISSIAVVLVFFGMKAWFDLGQLGWMSYLAGGLLIGLGVWELRPHAHKHAHAHGHHPHDPSGENAGAGGGKSLWALAGAAFVLGFAHEEEFEIIGLCAGSELCLELMLVYAATVIAAIVALTLALIAGYDRWRHRLEHLAPHLPKVSGGILIAMGLGFIAGWI